MTTRRSTDDANIRYRRTQRAVYPYWLLGGISVIVIATLVMSGDEDRFWTWFSVVVLVFVAVLVTLFSRLHVTVTEDTVTAAFTAGWPVKQVAVRDITAVEAVRNTWWYGWGIRWIPNDGTMYNVSGLDAVRLEIEGSKPFRIGTDDPRGLVEAVRSAGRIPD